MSSSEETEAERMFWRLPEMAETLLPYLDVESILCLAQCHHLTLQLLQGTSDWNKMIKRVVKGVKIVGYHPIQKHSIHYQANFLGLRERLAPEIQKMACLVDLLKMMESPEAHLRALLELVCDRFPPHQYGPLLLYNDNDGGDGRTKLGTPNIDLSPLFGAQLVNCTRHIVSPLGYLLLEKVEADFGSKERSIRGTPIYFMGKPKVFKGILRVGRNEDLRDIWEALGPGPEGSLDVDSTCGWHGRGNGGGIDTFYKDDGETAWSRLLTVLLRDGKTCRRCRRVCAIFSPWLC